MAPRKPTPAQLRDRRARIAVAVLGCVLLAVGGIQGPKLLSALNGSSGSSAPNAVQTTGLTTTGQTVSAAPGVVVPTASSSLGQIDGFGLFSPQNPFRSQLPAALASTGATGATPPPTLPASTTQPTATKPATTTQAKTGNAKPTPPPVTFTTTNPQTGVAAAVLKINGKRALIGVGGTFPVKSPLFRFAALAGTHLRIGVVGGTFADGRAFLTLQVGREVTLLNESDGTRFVIRFVHMTNAPLNMLTSPSSTTAAGFQPGAPAPASQTTTTR